MRRFVSDRAVKLVPGHPVMEKWRKAPVGERETSVVMQQDAVALVVVGVEVE